MLTVVNIFSPYAAALDRLPRKADDDCLQKPRWIYDRCDLAEARADLAEWVGKWQGKYPKRTGWVKETIEETRTFHRLPRRRHKHKKRTNMLGRFNEEISAAAISCVHIFANAASCLRPVSALAVETEENRLETSRHINL